MVNQMNEQIMVSIICNAYNQENYIEDALKGFIMQKTDFAYEVLIHDDASKDKTADIIRKYEKGYPDMIKPYYQTENKYSQRISVTKTFQYPRVKGKYIAFCEGDDYWTDENKLQKQVDMMEQNPKYGVCAHAVNMVDAETKNVIKKISPYEGLTVVPMEKVIVGQYVGTCSLMFRKEAILPLSETLQKKHFDYTMRLHGAVMGEGMLYIDDVMGAYRSESESSWSKGREKDRKKVAEHQKSIIEVLKIFDHQTEYKYTKLIENRIARLEALAMMNNNSDKSKASNFMAMSGKQKAAFVKSGLTRIGRRIKK